jgi:hypothetical protein
VVERKNVREVNTARLADTVKTASGDNRIERHDSIAPHWISEGDGVSDFRAPAT